MSKQLTFYFIRHGRTQWNEQGLLQGSGNSPLTEQGIAGAQKTGAALQQVELPLLIPVFYNAPLIRLAILSVSVLFLFFSTVD